MSSIAVKIIDDVFTEPQRRDVAARIADVLVPVAGERAGRVTWLVVATPHRPQRATDGMLDVATARPAARPGFTLDYATWHAHLSGTRR